MNEPLLTAAEEVALAKIIEAGGPDAPDARRRFIAANVRLVHHIANRLPAKHGLTHEDYAQEGVIGLARAVDKFDWRQGHKFSTYATWWIRQSIQNAIGKASPIG